MVSNLRARFLGSAPNGAASTDVEMLPTYDRQKLVERAHRASAAPEPRPVPSVVLIGGEEYPREVTIQPHTDEGGDAYYIGDIYENIKCAGEGDGWGISLEGRPYLKYVKRVSQDMPHLEYLAHWMQVTAAPPIWKFLKNHPNHREKRAARTKVCVMDFDASHKLTGHPVYDSCGGLESALDASPQSDTNATTRLIIAEDLSRDLVEFLGFRYDIDPLFFLSHLGDYLFNNTRDRWAEVPDLDVIARQRCHFNLQYLRGRYFPTPECFDEAERESGLFNVLRRLDSDRSRKRLQEGLLDKKGASVTFMRTKTSVWFKPRSSTEPVLAILLVDPTVKKGRSLWCGYRPFEQTPSMNDIENYRPPEESSLFESVIHWSSKMTVGELTQARDDARCVAIPMYRIVLADWRIVLKYMMGMLGKIEWEFEDPHWSNLENDIDKSLRKLSPWRRNVPNYQGMIADSMDRLFPPQYRTELSDGVNARTPTPSTGVLSLLYDFRLVQKQMDACSARIERIQTVATNSINIEESRRAVKQNKNLARLTFLATFFIPLNFTTSFLSMSPGFASAASITTVWLFFALGIPLTLFALLVVDLCNPQEGFLKTKWKSWQKRREMLAQMKDPNAATYTTTTTTTKTTTTTSVDPVMISAAPKRIRRSASDVQQGSTIPWFINGVRAKTFRWIPSS